MKTIIERNQIAYIKTAFLILCILVLGSNQNKVNAQDSNNVKPSWYFGIAAGANVNFYNGTTQQLTDNIMNPAPFHEGLGVGLYLGPLIEFHRPAARWGFMLQGGYDNRMGTFKEVKSPCNCPSSLKTNLTYLTIEPSLRFQPFKGKFYLFGGPRLGYNIDQSFTYQQKPNPQFPAQPETPAVKGDFSKGNSILISAQVGAGFDIPLSKEKNRTQFVLSPYVSFHPYFGQNPRSIETWNVTTLRAGAIIKFGVGHSLVTKAKKAPEKIEKPEAPIIATPNKEVNFAVNSPKNNATERLVKETFPLRNYVFFDLGSTLIPNRYVLLEKNQVQAFKDKQLNVAVPKNLAGRSERQMVVYYNILNILGDRMQEIPASTITLVGSSEKGPADARLMGESIKNYLVTIYDIDPTRIKVEGRSKPALPSSHNGGTEELDLLAAGDRRVSIESNTPALLMEFSNGKNNTPQTNQLALAPAAPKESYLSFIVPEANTTFTTWSLEVSDENHVLKYFGPYTQDTVFLSGESILGNKPEGDYQVTMIGKTKDGNLIKKVSQVHMVLWQAPLTEEGFRYSVIFEFNNAQTPTLYKKYLTDVITPKIPFGATISIHGYADIIGNEAHNLKLSKDRAEDVRRVLSKSLNNAHRKDVKFDVIGEGENPSAAQFSNKYPEERFYNRTVVVDILPAK